MRQSARFRNYYRKTISPRQRRNRWLLYATMALLAIGGNRWAVSCTRVELPQQSGRLAVVVPANQEGLAAFMASETIV